MKRMHKSGRNQSRFSRAVESLESRLLLSATRYVDLNSPGPAHDGASWDSAYIDLQQALAAATAGDQIHVADGTYTPTADTDRAICFQLMSEVSLLGGYAGYGATDPDSRDLAANVTVLSGDIGTLANSADNSYHVVVGSDTDVTAVLDGFTITGGNASGGAEPGNGGGIYNAMGSPTVRNCTFSGNSAIQGGGMYNDSSSPRVSNCTFSDNSVVSGGGMFNQFSTPRVNNCAFSENSSRDGGGMLNYSSSATVSNCTFSDNAAGLGDGGGMANYTSSPSLSNCIFSGNSAGDGAGGGIYNFASSALVSKCTFIANSATTFGGGIFHGAVSGSISNCTFIGNSADAGGGLFLNGGSPTVSNCTFSGNLAESSGGGMGFYSGSSSTRTSAPVSSCTFSGNSASYGAEIFATGVETSVMKLSNSIVWGNRDRGYNQISVSYHTLTITYSDIQGGWTGTGNINADPLFVLAPSPGVDDTWGTSDDFGDLRILAASPAADAGSNSLVPAGTTPDLAGNSRFVDIPTTLDSGPGIAPVVDMGAYEAVPALTAHPGGPYLVLAGQSLTLSGRGASSTPGALQYAWEWNEDGDFGEANIASPIFSTAAYPAGTVLTISLRVTDSASQSTIASTTLRVVPAISCVDVNSPASGAANGTSWSSAFTSLARALDWAVPGQTIRVADGAYRPTTGTDRNATFGLMSGVSLLGGYAGYGAADPDARSVTANNTALSGDIGTAADRSDNSHNVVLASGTDSTAVLDGFTITGASIGMYNYQAWPSVSNCTFSDNLDGGGMVNENSSPGVSNCAFIRNSTVYDGGGMHNISSSPKVTNCIFSGNTTGSTGTGGGMYNSSSSPIISNCIFSGSSARYGGGMYNDSSSPKLTNCTFSGESASAYGGGMYNDDSSSPVLTNCTFNGNSASSYGGGMYNFYSSPTLTNCTFSGNSGYQGGGGMYNYSSSSPALTNCTFSGNSANDPYGEGNGGGMYNFSSSPRLTNCTFSGNSASKYGGGIYNRSSSSPKLTNCIIWGSGSSPIYNDSSTPVITNSDIQGGWTGTGNLNSDPLFARNPSPGPDTVWGTADDDYGDLRLQASSPCIDAGSNSLVPAGITTDLAGNSRFFNIPGVRDPGAIVDMGAYEYAAWPTVTSAGFLYETSQRIRLQFSTNVFDSLAPNDLLIQNLTSGQSVPPQLLAKSSGATQATWLFYPGSGLGDGNYRITLPAGSVSDTAGNPLAADFTFDFFVLAGDANRDRIVDISDLGILATNWQGTGKTFSEGDFNYDGIVDITDLGILATSWQKSLPAPSHPVSRQVRPATQPGTTPIRSPFAAAPLASSSARRSLVEDVGLGGAVVA